MITTTDIKRLREQTGAGILDCREALRESGGDHDKALELLREKGARVIEKRGEREAAHGYVATYCHQGRIGAMVELRCETDFVSGNQLFRDLAHELALQVAASAPRWVSRQDVPAEVVAEVVLEERTRATRAGKPDGIIEQVIAGRLERFYGDNCLLEQTSIKDEKSTVNGLIQDKLVAFNERIYVTQFARFAIE